MNKLLRLLLARLLVTVLALGIVACGEEDTAPVTDDTDQTDTTNEPEHTHKWAAATCKAPKTCKTCGETEGKALAHTEKILDAVPATCTEDGKTEGKVCSVCNTVIKKQEVIPAAHTPAAAVEDNRVEATCVAAGSYDLVVKCSECGEEISRTPQTIPATGEHAWNEGEVTKAPEVGVAGEKTFTCTVCEATKTEAIDPLPNPEPPSGEPTWEEYNVNLNTQGIKILGERNATKASDGRIWLDWAGSGIEMNVRLDFTYTVRIFLQAMAEEGTCTFAIYVDGELFGEGYYTIACGLEEQFIDVANVPAGNHVIRIVKVTDYTTTSAEILMIYMDGEFLETPADNDLYIEFIGDAITTGYDDVTKSYAWIVAEAFNADYAITALNGYGLVNGSAEVGTGSMAQDYLKLNPLRDDTTPFRYENREADVIVINLGAEDYYYDELFSGELFPDAFQAAYEALIADARYYNPNAKILCVYGAANDGYADAILLKPRKLSLSAVLQHIYRRG